MACRPTDKDFAAMRAGGNRGPDDSPPSFDYLRYQDPASQAQVPRQPPVATGAASFNVTPPAPAQYAGRSGAPFPQTSAQCQYGMSAPPSQVRAAAPSQPAANQAFTLTHYYAFNREMNPIFQQLHDFEVDTAVAGAPNYQVREGFTPAEVVSSGRQQLRQPRLARDFQVPTSQTGASGSFEGSGLPVMGRAPQGLAPNTGQTALLSHQHVRYGPGQSSMSPTLQYQPNQGQFRGQQNAISSFNNTYPPLSSSPTFGVNRGPMQVDPSVNSQVYDGQSGPAYLPQGQYPNNYGGNFPSHHTPVPMPPDAALIGSWAKYGLPLVQSQGRFGAYGDLRLNFSGTSLLTDRGVANDAFHTSASASPEDSPGISSGSGGDDEDGNENASMSSSSSDATLASAAATATTATAALQNPAARPNKRTNLNNLIGRINSGSKYGADIRGRPSLQARPPLNIDITADEILAYYPNALHHPEVIMRLTKAGWAKRDLAKAQLYATGNLTEAKLKTSEDRIQKQISEGGKAYCGLDRRSKWNGKEHLRGHGMFDDLTANGWKFRHFHNNVFPNLVYEDVPLTSISAFVVNKPQGAGRGLLSWMLEYAEGHPQEELTTADFPKIMRDHKLQIPARLNSAHDVQALKDMRKMFEDLKL